MKNLKGLLVEMEMGGKKHKVATIAVAAIENFDKGHCKDE